MNSSILIIDVSHVFYSLIFSMPELSHEERRVHIIFGFMNKILALASRFETNKFIFCFDSKKSLRRDFYPPYKEKRRKEKTPEEIEMFQIGFRQLQELEESVLPKLGFKNIFKAEGFESDDLIAHFVIKYGKKFNFVVVSNDEDLFQLLDNCSLYNSKKDVIYSKDHLLQEYGLAPSQWIEVKTIAGCKSDCVEGVAGIGEKTAAKFINGELKEGSKKHQDIITTPQTFFDRNRQLVELPYPGTPDFKLRIDEKFEMKDFVGVCEQFGFRSLLHGHSYDKWSKIFCEG